MTSPIKNTDLTQDDLDFISEILNDYLEYFDEELEFFNGIDEPKLRHAQAETLYGRLIGVDLSGNEPPEHHIDCTCDWCEANRGS